MKKIAIKATVAFVVFVPLVTFVLLVLKGLPRFAAGHEMDVLFYVYQGTWLPALVSGVLFSLMLFSLRSRMAYFVQPYDFGRCFSLGAIVGALAEAFSTWIYRFVTQHPFSGFWIGGAMIAGSLTGALVCAVLLRPTKR